MIIQLTKSRLFTVEPAKRFAKEFGVEEIVWIKLWAAYKIKDYSMSDLREYSEVLLKNKLSSLCLRRWIIRTEIYSIAYTKVLQYGATTVSSTIFGKYEKIVLDEVVKGIRFSDTQKSRILL